MVRKSTRRLRAIGTYRTSCGSVGLARSRTATDERLSVEGLIGGSGAGTPGGLPLFSPHEETYARWPSAETMTVYGKLPTGTVALNFSPLSVLIVQKEFSPKPTTF